MAESESLLTETTALMSLILSRYSLIKDLKNSKSVIMESTTDPANVEETSKGELSEQGRLASMGEEEEDDQSSGVDGRYQVSNESFQWYRRRHAVHTAISTYKQSFKGKLGRKDRVLALDDAEEEQNKTPQNS